MKDAIYIPLQVFGLGFAISMIIAVLMKVLMDVIRHFSKETQE